MSGKKTKQKVDSSGCMLAAEYADNHVEWIGAHTRAEIIEDRKLVAFQIHHYMSGGMSLDRACWCAGISPNRYQDWVREGKAQLVARARDIESIDDMSFIVGMAEKAESNFELEMLANVTNHAKRDWKAAAWLLERRCRENWSNTPIEKIDENATITFNVSIGKDGSINSETITDSALFNMINDADRYKQDLRKEHDKINKKQKEQKSGGVHVKDEDFT